MKKIESYLPVFPGFYGTYFEPDETPSIEDGRTSDDYDWDYKGYEIKVSIACVDAIENQLNLLGFNLSIKFQELYSPKEYNFKNDSINVEYKFETGCIKAVKKYIKANLAPFAVYINQHFSSYSGFISFYSNDYKDCLPLITLKEFNNDSLIAGVIFDFILTNEDYTHEDLYDNINYSIYVNGTLKPGSEYQIGTKVILLSDGNEYTITYVGKDFNNEIRVVIDKPDSVLTCCDTEITNPDNELRILEMELSIDPNQLSLF